MPTHEIAALLVFVATITMIVARPRRIPEWLAAFVGAVAMVVVGAESISDGWQAVAAQWDVLLFFAGLMTIIAVAESAGFFSWVAFLSARTAKGSARQLFLGVIFACAVVTVFLTNDAAALVMTPLVFSLASRLRLHPLPYAFACTFVANGASAVLPMSNPVNVIISEAANLTLNRYLAILWLPSLLAAVVTAAILWLALGRRLRRRFDASNLAAPEGDPQYRAEVALLLLLAAVMLVSVTAAGSLIGVAACAAAAVMLLHGALRRRLDLRRIVGDANPTVVVLVAALFTLAEGLTKSGLMAVPVNRLVRVAQTHTAVAGSAMAVATALGSNLFNNLPTAALANTVLRHAPLTTAVAHRVAAGAIIGCDLGPNLTIVGSLSTLLWIVLLRRRGFDISFFGYAKLGLLVAPISLLAAIVGLMVTR